MAEQDLKTTVDKIVDGTIDKETIDAIVDPEPDKELFGETLGSVDYEEKPLTSPQEDDKKGGELELEKAVPAAVKPVEVKKEVKEPEVAEGPKDELADQIKAAVEAALPKEESKAEDNKLTKQLTDTRNYATQVNQQNGELRQGITTIEAQLAEATRQLKDAGIEITPQRQQITQYQPQIQQPVNDQLAASLSSADSKFTPAVVDEYLHPQNGKFHKMMAAGITPENQQKLNTSLDPLVEAITLTKEWEQGLASEVTRKAEDREALINDIVAKVQKRIGVSAPLNTGKSVLKSVLPTNLSSIRADSNVAKTKITAGVDEHANIFKEYLG